MVAEAESITVEVLDMMASEARGTVQVNLRRGRLSGSAWFSRSDKACPPTPRPDGTNLTSADSRLV